MGPVDPGFLQRMPISVFPSHGRPAFPYDSHVNDSFSCIRDLRQCYLLLHAAVHSRLGQNLYIYIMIRLMGEKIQAGLKQPHLTSGPGRCTIGLLAQALLDLLYKTCVTPTCSPAWPDTTLLWGYHSTHKAVSLTLQDHMIIPERPVTSIPNLRTTLTDHVCTVRAARSRS